MVSKQRTEIMLRKDEVTPFLMKFRTEVKRVEKEYPLAVADDLRRRYIRLLKSQGSVVTGTGIRNINTRTVKHGTAIMSMPEYLRDVDTGTPAHPVGVAANPRLYIWAQQKGMDPFALADHIGKEGTRAHPFRDKAFTQTKKTSGTELANQVGKAIARSM